MLSADNNYNNNQKSGETEFGSVLWKIVRYPTIPTSPHLIVNDNPPEASRLRRSRLNVTEYQQVRERWIKFIEKKKYKGLSLQDFINMLCDLFGVEDGSPESPMTFTALHRLICTCNPKIKIHSVSIQENNLKLLSCFTTEYTFEELLDIGRQLLKEYELAKAIAQHKKEEIYQLELDTPENNDLPTLKELLVNHFRKNGVETLFATGVSKEDLLRLVYDDDPKIYLSTLTLLKSFFGESSFKDPF